VKLTVFLKLLTALFIMHSPTSKWWNDCSIGTIRQSDSYVSTYL